MQKSIAVLHGDGFYFDRLFLRQSPVCHSSRIYYRSAEGVPFHWETQPGTPKNPPENEVIPPPSPPPAVQSLGLSSPCVHQSKHSKNLWKVKVQFWKRSKKKECNVSNGKIGLNEFMGSVHDSSSSASWSSSSSNCPPLQSPGFQKDSLDRPFVCSSWNVTPTLREKNANRHYCNKDVTRNSSGSDQPSCFYYRRNTEGVPFKWEKQPGKSKVPQEDEAILPPTPPPAVQSRILPRPCIDLQPEHGPIRSTVWFWKKKPIWLVVKT
ncbi:hypothetical protein U1Q18_026538 [Sarracenia purpurea var. burkii]